MVALEEMSEDQSYYSSSSGDHEQLKQYKWDYLLRYLSKKEKKRRDGRVDINKRETHDGAEI